MKFNTELDPALVPRHLLRNPPDFKAKPMLHAIPCNQCSQTGLPILFTRYAAAYSASQSGMDALDTLKTGGTLKVRPSGVTLNAAKCNVRMLRAGYLYIRLETKIRHPEWLGYAVHPHGYLTQFNVDYPEGASAETACRPNEWGGNRSLVWIKDVDAITKLHFMFHPLSQCSRSFRCSTGTCGADRPAHRYDDAIQLPQEHAFNVLVQAAAAPVGRSYWGAGNNGLTGFPRASECHFQQHITHLLTEAIASRKGFAR